MARSRFSRKTSTTEPVGEFTHIFANSPIDNQLYSEILRDLQLMPRTSTAVLTLVTHGGSANDAYRIARFLQIRFEKLYVHVPSTCASAGTLLVCAGQSIILSPLSELGPLDAQLLKADELYTRRSSLVVRSLFEDLGQRAFELHTSLVENIIRHSQGTIKYRTAAHVASEMVVGLLHGLYDQINPEQMGEDYRFLRVAEEYGKRIIEKSQNISEEDLRTLIFDFPAHDFVIDFKEVVGLFNNVCVPSTELQNLLADGELTPLEPMRAHDRVVKIEQVDGSPFFTPSPEDQPDDEAATGGSDGSAPGGGDESALGEPPLSGAHSERSAKRAGGKRANGSEAQRDA